MKIVNICRCNNMNENSLDGRPWSLSSSDVLVNSDAFDSTCIMFHVVN